MRTQLLLADEYRNVALMVVLRHLGLMEELFLAKELRNDGFVVSSSMASKRLGAMCGGFGDVRQEDGGAKVFMGASD